MIWTLTMFPCRPYAHPLSLAKHLQLRTYQVWALEVRAYPQSTMLRWQHLLRENPLLRIARLGQFASLRQKFCSLSSNSFNNRRPRGTDCIACLRPTDHRYSTCSVLDPTPASCCHLTDRITRPTCKARSEPRPNLPAEHEANPDLTLLGTE